MKKKSFGDFCDKKKRDSIHQLELVKKILETTGMKVDNFLESDEENDPYIFCHNPSRNGSFDGVRVYKIGNEIAFRVQKESQTHPFGAAYPIPVESMFYDFLSDHGVNETKAGKKVIEAVGKELKRFFEKSIEAEQKDRQNDIEQSNSDIMLRSGGTDYSALVFSKGS